MKKSLVIFFVFVFIIIGQISIDIYLPSMPFMTHALHTNPKLMQYSITFMLITFAFSQLIVGPFAQRFGRKPVVLIGLIILILSNVAAALSHSIVIFLIARIFTGFGSGCMNVLARAILSDYFEGLALKRLSSYLYLSWATVPMVAPLIGSFLQYIQGWQLIFWFLTALAILAFFITAISFKEKLDCLDKTPLDIKYILNRYSHILNDQNKLYMNLLMCVVISSTTFITIVQFLPFYLSHTHGFTSGSTAWVLTAIGVATILGTMTNARRVKKHSTTRQATIGLLIMLICSAALCWFNDSWKTVIWGQIALLFILRFGVAWVLPGSQSDAMASQKDNSAYASALLGFSVYIGSTWVSLGMAHLPHQSSLPMSVALLLEAIMCTLIFLLRPNTTLKKQLLD